MRHVSTSSVPLVIADERRRLGVNDGAGACEESIDPRILWNGPVGPASAGDGRSAIMPLWEGEDALWQCSCAPGGRAGVCHRALDVLKDECEGVDSRYPNLKA